MTRAEKARELFLHGYNCAQAVLLAFCEDVGGDEALLAAISKPFGGGMGRLRLTCGGVSGGVMALGLLFPEREKSEMYALVQTFARRFREENGSVLCGDLLAGAGVAAGSSPNAEPRTAEYYKKRPCAELVFCAAQLAEELAQSEGRL